MTTQEITVAGMTCEHCVRSVQEELTRLEGVERVEVDLATGGVVIEASSLIDADAIGAAVAEAGYEVVS